MVAGVAAGKSVVVSLVPEQRFHALYLKIHLYTRGQLFNHGFQGNRGLVLLWIHGSAHSGKQVGMVRRNDLFLCKAEGTDEAFTQLGQEVEGAAQKGNIAPYGLSAGKAADGLVHHCLENGRGQVFPGSAFINQWLYI